MRNKKMHLTLDQEQANLLLLALEFFETDRLSPSPGESEKIAGIWKLVFDAGVGAGFGDSPPPAKVPLADTFLAEPTVSDLQAHDLFELPDEDEITGYPV